MTQRPDPRAPLDYAPASVPGWQAWARRHRRLLIVFLAITAAASCAGIARLAYVAYRQRQAALYATAFRVIDADVPGTEVYLGKRMLGVVPMVLSKADCLAMGLPIAPRSGRVPISFDGYGEGILLGANAGGPRVRLTLKAPTSAGYLTYQTTDGLRTRQAGGRDLPNGTLANLFSRSRQRQLSTTLIVPSAARTTDTTVPVIVRFSNHDSTPFVGIRPEIQLLCSNADAAWPHWRRHDFPAPSWTRIEPGATLETTLNLPVPAASGIYSVLALFNLSDPRDNGYLIGPGSIYSDSHLLQVK